MSFIDHIGAIFMPKKSFFDKEASLALKGIAIMMMMLHHNFRAHSLFDKYTISFYPFNEQQVVNLAASCKICVSLFASVPQLSEVKDESIEVVRKEIYPHIFRLLVRLGRKRDYYAAR